MILIAWFIIAAIFAGVPGAYYLQMKRRSTAPWKLNIDQDYRPSVAILVPVHNEEKTISLKLENLRKVKCPVEEMETIIVNDASTDNTLAEINQYVSKNSSLRIKVFDNTERMGKTNCLNRALKSINADVVIVSDADCFWPSDILLKALPYLSDSSVGGITARELLLNPRGSWVTLGEQFYDTTVQSIRIGESKTHSTVIFQGGFAAYKHEYLKEFNYETDDSGTALDIVQKHGRTLLLPEIGFYTTFPTIWKNKANLKIRRAGQLQHLWTKCLKLLLKGRLELPKKIAIPEIILHLFNPLLLIPLMVLSTLVFIQYPLLLLAVVSFFFLAIIFKKTRTTLIETLQNNFILLIALSSFLTKKRFRIWGTVQESRSLLNEDILREKQLL